MASWELQLISRIVRSGNLASVVQWGITELDFTSLEGRALFNMLLGYHQAPSSAGTVIGPYALSRCAPSFQFCDDDHVTTDALCSEVRKQRLVLEYRGLVQRQLELIDIDPMRAINNTQHAMSTLQQLGSAKTHDVFFHEGFARCITRMEALEQGIDLSCGLYPWYPLQDATGGLEPAEYIIIYGRPKSMKSWILAYLIAWFFCQQKRLVIYTKEMIADNIFQRAGACLAQVRYHEFRRARLSHEERASIYYTKQRLDAAQLQQTVVCLSAEDANEGEDTVPWLEAKVDQYKPDIVFIDGMYLMSDVKKAKKDNERVRNISRDIRRMTLKNRKPVIATVQANRAAAQNQEANLDEVAFSDALSQDATLLMRTINEKSSPTVALVMGGASREFALSGFRIYAVPALNFSYYGPLSDKEIESAKEYDKGEEGSTPKAAKKPTEAKAVEAVTRALDQHL